MLDSREMSFGERLFKARRAMLRHQPPPVPEPGAHRRANGARTEAIRKPHWKLGAHLAAHYVSFADAVAHSEALGVSYCEHAVLWGELW